MCRSGVVSEQAGEVAEEGEHEERPGPTCSQRPAADMQWGSHTGGRVETKGGATAGEETTP